MNSLHEADPVQSKDRGQALATVAEEVEEEEQVGLIEWDWLGEDSHMLADITGGGMVVGSPI